MESLTTKFAANASFNQIRLRHGGGGDGWTFSEMAIATSFSDFVVDESGIKSGNAGLAIGRGQLPFTFRVWQREQGLPQNFVRALAQTKDGYLWVGQRCRGEPIRRGEICVVWFAGRISSRAGADAAGGWAGRAVDRERGPGVGTMAERAVYGRSPRRRTPVGFSQCAGGGQGGAALGRHGSRVGGMAEWTSGYFQRRA